MRGKLAELHPRRFFLETWRRLDDEAEAARAARREAGHGFDVRPLVMFTTGTLFLILMEYWGMPSAFQATVRFLAAHEGDGRFFTMLPFSPWWELMNHAWWALWRVAGFFFFPLLVVKASRQRIRDQGLSFEGFRSHLWIYGLAYLVVLACVIGVSFTDEFTRYYPFYRLSGRSWLDFAIWELLYAAQFFALEFFFRGWWLQQSRDAMGSHAIWAMVVPYVMIHFGKPMAETIAAIVAGVVLGTLALKTRSIWSGFLIHVSVALSMDVASLLRRGEIPTALFPDL